ncbi:ubiquitin-conjugating enzyme E2 Q2 [Karstenula rhodostoma CBS 690.94]|uniref:Ubiquitin-conjugating enzyme E2 Q2 n=1 Tax=Karstenula rhodostoma CBS 690.94 TaxID=1392251 RepID=A0A9P4PQN5_9PLEO|nr:ubiquitin-conjugating enzyme E2 Q2 [Karstenula rhodostoma CBS 690.94]
MPRRQYIADLKKAEEGVSIAGISHVQTGGDDGEFTFLCFANDKPYKFSALIPDVSDYPSGHMYMLIAPDDAPEPVASALSGIAESAFGKSIEQLLELTSRKLESTDDDGDHQMLNSQDVGMAEEDSDDDDVDDFFPDDDEIQKPFSMQPHTASTQGHVQTSSKFRSRIRSDLLSAKVSGFKVGHQSALLEGRGCYVSISCRIAKLGISEEAMQAWQVQPQEYLVVIISYPNGYKNMSDMEGYDVATARRYFGVKIGISTTYKPTLQEAVQAFTKLSKEEEMKREKELEEGQDGASQSQGVSMHKGFRNSFISRPLHDLLENRFPQLLKFRYNGMSWNGAEEFYHDSLGSHKPSNLGLEDKYMNAEVVSTAYPSIVTADHIADFWTGGEHSLPLVCMQFVLRHFVRCTEFCLICFRKMPDDLQAIKPYVCEQPLCLYQYMSLGFGPSIEHEIISQPKVVDLLVSFCYTSAVSNKLNDFPTGLSLMVPPSSAHQNDYASAQQHSYNNYPQSQNHPASQAPTGDAEVKPGTLKFNAATKEIMFDAPEAKCPFKAGDWLVIRTNDNRAKALHCRISETYFYPTSKVAEPVVPTTSQLTYQATVFPSKRTMAPAPATRAEQVENGFKQASFYMYDQNFDSLSVIHKREAIYALLDLLPSVDDMRQYLQRKKQSTLSSWVDRLSPAALGVLRWIIASNRACIMQVDDPNASGFGSQERLCGMSGWTQFRFAMGAPDKERRFVQAVRHTSNRLNLKHDTLFAWHGSPLHNWHGIIREGLHFKDTAHGRAFGHGVYHSLDVNTSLSYSNINGGAWGGGWPMSVLRVSQALALNEIVNAPKEFVSSNPHLVVAQLDWIQTRYLFVQTRNPDYTMPSAPNNATKEVVPTNPIPQDSSYTPRGVSGHLVIPRSAIPSHRGQESRTADQSAKRRKTATGTSFADPIELDIDDDGVSVATLEEDLFILNEDPLMPQPQTLHTGIITPTPSKGKGKANTGFFSKLIGSKSSTSPPAQTLTDYVPGKLDYSLLPMLVQPAWATPSATRRLMQDFKAVIASQNKTPLHELGWHIDEEKMENMYQWIVELHSFDSTLPLAQDMKKRGVTSVVLEMRFGKDYPMSPPFVRVIKPRFLGFQQGGGGHVTAGGALCMELLTNNGWSAVSTIESVLLQVRIAMSSIDPKPARLENASRADYGVGEAVEAYIRACNVHGWTVPDGFREMALGGAAPGFAYS